MKYPNLIALLDITLNKDLLWTEKTGESYNQGFIKEFKFTTLENLQDKINKFLDNSDFYVLRTNYDDIEEIPTSKQEFYEFVSSIDENKDVNLIDLKNASIKLTFTN